MFKNLSYRQKLKVLGIASVPMLLLTYQLAIKNTLNEWRKTSSFASTAAKSGTEENIIIEMNRHKTEITRLENQYSIDSTLRDQQLLLALDSCCNRLMLTLKEYKPVNNFSRSNLIWTRLFTVEGGFTNILHLLYYFEQTHQLCRVSSVQYKSYVDTDKSLKLSCTIYVQNFIKNATTKNL